MKKNKLIALLLVFAMVFCLVLTGCGNQEQEEEKKEETSVFPMTVTDQLGREITIEEYPTKISTIYAVATTYVVALGKGNLLVTRSSGTTSPSIYDYVCPSVLELPEAGKKTVDTELLAQLESDLYIARSRDEEVIESVQDMGINSIGIAPETIEQVFETYELLGKLLNAEDRAAELKTAYENVMNKASSISAKIPESEKKTAIVMGSTIGKIANSSMLQSVLITTAGATNPAAEVETSELWPVVGVEQIFQWNPDYIFITSYGSTDYTVDDIMNDATWSEVNAVKNGTVMKTPGTLESWELPGPSSCLGALWMLNQMYPEYYSDADLEADVQAYYAIVYPDNTFTRDVLGY